jgi:hypothetical protein
MATVTNKRKVLSIEETVKNDKTNKKCTEKADACRKFGLVNSAIQNIWKKEPNY